MSKADHLNKLRDNIVNINKDLFVNFIDKKGDMDDCKDINNAEYILVSCLEPFIYKEIKILKNLNRFNEQYVLDKVFNKHKYISIYKKVSKILESANISHFVAYPASYGIGVNALFSNREKFEELNSKVKSVLESLGVKYRQEYSDAGWVLRYIISKNSL